RARRAWAPSESRRAVRDNRRLRAEARSWSRLVRVRPSRGWGAAGRGAAEDNRDAQDRVADSQYSGAAALVRESERIRRGALAPRRRVRGDQRSGHRGGFGLRILVDDPLPGLLRARHIVQAQMTEADLQQRVRRLRRTTLEDLPELDERLAVVALGPVCFPDPVLRVRGQRALGVLRDEVHQLEHG